MAALILALGTSDAGAASLTARLRRLLAGRQEVQGQIREIRRLQTSAAQRLGTAQARLEALQGRLTQAQAELAATRQELAQARAELARLEQGLQEHTGLVQEHLVALHKAGDSGFLEVLLQSESFYDFANRERFITALVNQDEYVLMRLTQLREQAQAQRERLVRQEERRAALQWEIAANESEARQRRAEVHAVLAEANDKRATAEGMLAEMEQEQQGIAAMLRARSSPSSTAARYEGTWSGRFLRPVEGRFTSGYGYRINPHTHTRRFHYGIDLACAQGTPIKAADKGLVLFAGWRGTVAGKTVILDHGDGMSTVYCHQSEVLVSAGDVVKRGQIIGQVGSTGWSTGPHLHFGVLRNGDFVDPASFVM